jgi:hypothetical protein
VIDLGGKLAHLTLRALGDLHHGKTRLLQLLQQCAGEHGIWIGVGIALAVER